MIILYSKSSPLIALLPNPLLCQAQVGYVQARWTFTNADESYLTKAQEISLNYHVKCEQWVHFASGGYFNFNGTAGVWRRECILDVGGWYSRTTVEDMDLSLRAHIGVSRALPTLCLDGNSIVRPVLRIRKTLKSRIGPESAESARSSAPSSSLPPSHYTGLAVHLPGRRHVPQRAPLSVQRLPQAAAPLDMRAHPAV